MVGYWDKEKVVLQTNHQWKFIFNQEEAPVWTFSVIVKSSPMVRLQL